MNAIDFEYDGLRASDFNLIFCQFDGSGGVNITSAGSELNWNTVPISNGNKYLITDTSYDVVLETTFQMCKYDCKKGSPEYLTLEDCREISRWLNRKEAHTLRIISENKIYDYLLFEGSFNLNQIEINGGIIGYEFHFISNRPHAIGDLVRKNIVATTTDYEYKFYDVSDESGYIYPKNLTIRCLQSGTLSIKNLLENRTTVIKNCSLNEIITFDDTLYFSSSLQSHKIQNDFNYVFFRIANTYENRLNSIVVNIPCEITFEYYPVIKGVAL